MATTYRPGSSRVLAGTMFVIGGIGLVALTVDQGITGLAGYGWWIGLFAALAWALFWNPRIVVDDSGVQLVNVFRTVTLPWPAITEIDTKWGLTIKTAYGSYSAWSAPAPGRYRSRQITEQDVKHLPESSYDNGHTVRPGDSTSSPSGQAARAIREHWDALRAAGHLDNPRLEFDRPPTRWHVATIAVLVALALLCVAGWVL